MNTGETPTPSKSGLLTTMGYKLGKAPAVYALEGSIAVTGALVQWMRDNLNLIANSPDIEALANTVPDSGGVYFVPAFSGLYAPYWKDSARGVIAGLTRFANKGHIARAVLEATAFQTRDVVEAMQIDSGIPLAQLRTDGGMVANDTLMQIQSDLLGCEVIRPRMRETTALGAAYAAGLACGLYPDQNELARNNAIDRSWSPQLPDEEKERRYRKWKKAIVRSFDWEDAEDHY
jgi:glycerol kinase